MKSYLLAAGFTVLSVSGALAQNVGINTTGLAPAASAMLDVDATNRGLLIPRVALTATNAAGPVTAPATSLLVYNTATAGAAPNNVTPGFYYWTGAAWSRFMNGNGNAWTTTGNAGTVATTNFIGTTDAIDFIVRSNNVERMRVFSDGRVAVNSAATFPTSTFFSAASGNNNAVDGSAAGTGSAVFGQSIGAGGRGVNGLSNNATGFGVSASNINTSGTGLIAVGNNSTPGYLTAGSAGAFTGSTVGVYSVSTNTSAAVGSAGVLGRDGNPGITTFAGGTGLMGLGASSATAVIAYNTGTTAANFGVYSEILSTASAAIIGFDGIQSVYGSTLVANGTGVYGDGNAGNNSVGVWGETYNSGTNSVGVFGRAITGGANRYGGFFTNDLGSTGTKPFMIDHPQDPENKYLKHFSMESPEILNMYRGNVMLDANGEGTITMPGYFTSVNNTNYSYHLTPVGANAQVWVAEEINSGVFKIKSTVPNIKVSWMVMTERNDPYLQQYPEERQVEIEKEDNAKGKYLVPELYGKTQKDAIYHTEKHERKEKIQQQETKAIPAEIKKSGANN